MRKNARVIACLLAAALFLSLPCGFVCGTQASAEPAVSKAGTGIHRVSVTADETWAVYMYICGSDLESKHGFATDNLSEIKFKQMPGNLKIVIETGGTTEWQNDLLNSQCLQRWELDETGYHNLADLPLSNMGEEQTFESFLKFCHDSYPADKTMLLIWDHGGGTCYGACYDDNYPDTGSLSIRDIHEAVTRTFGSDETNPPLDILAFDCCLMSTLDVADLFKDAASYLLASEELVPGGGFNYDTFIKLFRNNPAIDAKELGMGIVDGYTAKYLSEEDAQGTVTLSLTDLSKAEKVKTAVDVMFGDLLKLTYDNPDFFLNVSLIADTTQSYGGNSRAEGYTNLMDVRDFASQIVDFVPSAQAVTEAVDEAVVYQTYGDYRAYSGGLSVFFNYNADEADMNKYLENGTSDALKAFYSITSFNSLPDMQKGYVRDLGLDTDSLPAIKSFDSVDTSNRQIRKNSEGRYYVDFGPEVGACTTDAMFELYYVGDNDIYYLGSDDEINYDFNEGLFIDNFGGKWMCLGDWIACMDLDVDSDQYHIYSMPVQIDGDTYYLQLGYDFDENVWEELGLRYPGNEPGTASSFVLDEGTPFTVIQSTVNDEGELEYFPVAELVYDSSIWKYGSLPDGCYEMAFRLEDVHKNRLYSEPFFFWITDGELDYSDY